MAKPLNIIDAESLKAHCNVLINGCWVYRGMRSDTGEPKVNYRPLRKTMSLSKLTPYLLGIEVFSKSEFWVSVCKTKNCANLDHREPVAKPNYQKYIRKVNKECKTITDKAYPSIWHYANDKCYIVKWKQKPVSFK